MMRQTMITVKNTLEEAQNTIRAEREQINYLYPEFATVANVITPVILFWFQTVLYIVGAVDRIGCKAGSCISTIIQTYPLMVQLLFVGYLICPVGWRTMYVEVVACGYMLYKFFAQQKAERAKD